MINFIIPGKPIGKARPRFCMNWGQTWAYTPKSTMTYENLIKKIAIEAMKGKVKFKEAVSVKIDLSIRPPDSWTKTKKNKALAGDILPITRPDIDNVLKGICDALNNIVYDDDKQICNVSISKKYGAESFAAVQVENY